MQNVVLFWGHLLPLQESSLFCHITRNHAYIGAMKALQPWVAKNARRCSLIWVGGKLKAGQTYWQLRIQYATTVKGTLKPIDYSFSIVKYNNLLKDSPRQENEGNVRFTCSYTMSLEACIPTSFSLVGYFFFQSTSQLFTCHREEKCDVILSW